MEEDGELLKICGNCNDYLPYPFNETTGYGVCLKNPEFKPYLDRILEEESYNCCEELAKKKSFNGNSEPCEDFSFIEFVEEDSLSENFMNLEDPDFDKVLSILMQNKILEKESKMLKNPNREVQMEAVKSLSGYAAYNNKNAVKLLLDFFKNIPVPADLVETHFKINMFNKVNSFAKPEDFLPSLKCDLFEMKPDNSTRQWVAEIFKFLNIYRKHEKVKELLWDIYYDKRFTYRIKYKAKNILDNDYY